MSFERKKNIVLFPAHPSQVWILRQVAEELSSFANISWVIRDKDISLKLADILGIQYETFTRASRGILGNGVELIRNTARAIWYARKNRVDFWISKYGAAHLTAWLLQKKSIAFIDDDIELIPLVAWTSFPFANLVLAPDVTRMGRFNKKTIRFAGNFELFYLHPKRFSPDASIYNDLGINKGELFAIIRLSALTAHHDIGKKGISQELLRQIVGIAGAEIKIFITSEKPLDFEFEKYRMPIPPHKIHHALAFAEFFVGDSQTMTLEAATLGTPAFRVSSFVGRISIIEELEKAGLAFGFKTEKGNDFIEELGGIITLNDRKKVFADLRDKYLKRVGDPLPIFVDTIKSLLDI